MSKKFATLNDVKGGGGGGGGHGHSHDSGEDSDGEEGQSFFVGGSEHSGQQVLGPPGQNRDRDTAGRVFQAARAHGAETVDPDEEESNSSGRGAAFPTSGMRLGDNVVPSQPINPAPAAAGQAQDNGELPVTLVMYDNGFVVDEGEFRAFDDPAAAAFLNDITQGRLPRELIQAHPGRRISMRMERRGGAYVPPKVKAFAGSGQRLGAPTPQVVDVDAPPEPAVITADEAEKLLKEAQDAIKLDDSQKPTQIQVRLPDGRRLVGRFNPSSTVMDVRAFIATAAPTLAFGPFELRTAYPNAAIEEEAKTLQDAALLNAVILVRQK